MLKSNKALPYVVARHNYVSHGVDTGKLICDHYRVENTSASGLQGILGPELRTYYGESGADFGRMNHS
jgi:hypothetical protein